MISFIIICTRVAYWTRYLNICDNPELLNSVLDKGVVIYLYTVLIGISEITEPISGKNCLVSPSSMSGGSPPTNTFLLNRSPCSDPPETGDERAGEPSALTHMDSPEK